MEKINIQIPEGYQIDLEKSDLVTGQIIFKKVEKKKPLKFEDLEEIEGYFINGPSDINDYCLTFNPDCDKNVFPQKDQCEAVLALSQLLQLYKAWKEFDTERKLTIWRITFLHGYVVLIDTRTISNYLFSFNDLKLATEFKDTFIDLFEKLKPISLL